MYVGRSGQAEWVTLLGNQTQAKESLFALAGNRTRASRVAGENSTTEPPMRVYDDIIREFILPVSFKLLCL